MEGSGVEVELEPPLLVPFFFVAASHVTMNHLTTDLTGRSITIEFGSRGVKGLEVEGFEAE